MSVSADGNDNNDNAASGGGVSNGIDTLWLFLAAVTVAMRLALFVLARRRRQKEIAKKDASPHNPNKGDVADGGALALCLRYLPCFLMFKAADWMQGPYLYDVYVAHRVAPHNACLLYTSPSPRDRG